MATALELLNEFVDKHAPDLNPYDRRHAVETLADAFHEEYEEAAYEAGYSQGQEDGYTEVDVEDAREEWYNEGYSQGREDAFDEVQAVVDSGRP